jgi:hypothetical protein
MNSRSKRRSVAAAAVVAVVVAAAVVTGLRGHPRAPVAQQPQPQPMVTSAIVPAVAGPIVRVAPNGTGNGQSESWADAAPLIALPLILETAAPGTQVWLLGDRGPYQVNQEMTLTRGGTADSPVIVRGVDENGRPKAAEIIGKRADPYDPGGAGGGEVFRLMGGADHLVFQELAFRNVGNGAFRIAADITDLTVRQSTAVNVRRLIEDYAIEPNNTATVTGLTVTNVIVNGYSRGVARLQYDSHRILFDDVHGDSQGQDGDTFPIGLHLDGTVHDVDIRDTSMAHSVSTEGRYWNGDGFATEALTYDIRFTRTSAFGHTDAGYDLKSRSTVLKDATAYDSKRNFRFWGEATVDGCRATNPVMRGGSGSQAQIYATSNAVVTVRGCTISDNDPNTIVFDLEGNAKMTVTDTVVKRSPQARLETVDPGAHLETIRVQVE